MVRGRIRAVAAIAALTVLASACSSGDVDGPGTDAGGDATEVVTDTWKHGDDPIGSVGSILVPLETEAGTTYLFDDGPLDELTVGAPIEGTPVPSRVDVAADDHWLSVQMAPTGLPASAVLDDGTGLAFEFGDATVVVGVTDPAGGFSRFEIAIDDDAGVVLDALRTLGRDGALPELGGDDAGADEGAAGLAPARVTLAAWDGGPVGVAGSDRTAPAVAQVAGDDAVALVQQGQIPVEITYTGEDRSDERPTPIITSKVVSCPAPLTCAAPAAQHIGVAGYWSGDSDRTYLADVLAAVFLDVPVTVSSAPPEGTDLASLPDCQRYNDDLAFGSASVSVISGLLAFVAAPAAALVLGGIGIGASSYGYLSAEDCNRLAVFVGRVEGLAEDIGEVTVEVCVSGTSFEGQTAGDGGAETAPTETFQPPCQEATFRPFVRAGSITIEGPTLLFERVVVEPSDDAGASGQQGGATHWSGTDTDSTSSSSSNTEWNGSATIELVDGTYHLTYEIEQVANYTNHEGCTTTSTTTGEASAKPDQYGNLVFTGPATTDIVSDCKFYESKGGKAQETTERSTAAYLLDGDVIRLDLLPASNIEMQPKS